MTERRTPEEWGVEYGIEVRDPDGWRRRDDPPWEEPITLIDYRARVGVSTVRLIRPDAWDRIIADTTKEATP